MIKVILIAMIIILIILATKIQLTVFIATIAVCYLVAEIKNKYFLSKK